MLKKFMSIDKKHSFDITILEDTAYLVICALEPSHYKTFLLLLKSGFEHMKKKNVKFVKQEIRVEDKELFKKSTFIDVNEVTIVKTHIDDFILEICGALGIVGL